MKRSAIAIAATFLSTLVLCTAAWGQSRLPANPAVYLQNTNLAGNGDPDGISVIFFQVPEGTLSPLYFAVYSPGTNSTQNNRDSTNAGAMATTFTLIGGTGAYSGTNSQNIQFTAANTPYQGTVLGQQSYTNTNGNTWVYFPGVDYSQGEKIGNQYIFKLVVDTNAIVTWGAGTNAYTGQTTTNGGDKNAFQVDISTTNSGAPTGISGVRSFAYNWKVCFYEISTDIWNFYPLVPDTALATDFINFYNWDADDGDSWTILNKSGATLTNDVWDFLTTRTPPGTVGTVTTEIGTNNAWGNFSHSIGALSETQGTWNMRVTANAGGTALNTTAIVASLSGAAAVPPVAPSGTILPIYAAAYNPPGPDHVVLNPTSKTVISGTPTDVPISMQIVDSTGTPVPTVRKVRVQTNGTATVNGVDNDEIVTTNAAGSASFFVRQNGNAVVLVTLTSNGTFGSDNFGPGADDSATVTFQADLPPTISSATNLSYPSNQAAPINLPVITIADSGAANITASNLTGDIRIRPSTLNTGLTAPFLNSVTTPTLTVGGVGTGAVNGTVSYLGGVLLIDVTNDFAVTNTLTIGTGTKLQIDASADAPSSGRLEMSVDGGVTWTILDDKLITVIDPNPTYTWSGATSGVWTLGSNWSGGTAPSLNNGTENIIIPNGCLNYPTLPAALWSINNLTIDTAANLSIGANNLTINGAFNNNGTLIVSGAGRPSKMDKDSGTVRYTVLGGLISEFGTPDFYNLVLLPAAAGTFTTSGTLSIANNLTIGVNATLDIAALDLGVTGSFTNSGRLRLNGVAAQSVSAPTINSAASFIEYYGGTAGFTAGNSYANLSVSGGTRTATAGLAVSETVTVALGATLDLSSYALTGATTFTNNGTVRISDGGQTVAGAKTNGASSTVQYYGTGAGTGLASWGTAYNNLTVNGAGNYPAGGSLTVASALTVSGGTISGLAGLSLSAASIDLSSAAAFALDANGGTFQLAATGGTNIGLGAGAGAFQLTNAELLKIRASGLTIAASGAGAITSDTVVTTGATHGTLTLSGASSITFSGGASTFVSGLSATTTSATANALSVATSLTATAGDIALTGGTGNLAISAAAILGAAAGTITVQASGAGTVNLGANLTLQAALISQPAETIAMGANALTLRADEINFAAGASVTGIGALAIDTLNAARPILLLAPDDLTVTRLNLTLTDLSAFAGATYASLTLGRSDGTGTITTNGALSANLPPLIFEGDDAIANLIQVDALINSTTAGRSISFRAPVRLGANVSTNNALIEFQRAVVVRDGTSPIISSGAGAGDITFLAAATINGVAAGGNETLSLNSGTGAVNLGSAIGGNASLYDLSVTSGAALALPAITLSNNLNATTTVGGITDNGTLIIPGAATLSVPLAQSVSFDLATNDFGTFAVSQGLNASVVDVNGIIIGTTTLAGTLGVSAGGAITDSGAISVALASSFATTAGNAAITLNDGNTFSSTLALNPNGAGNASVTNAVSNLNLAASTVGGDLTLSCLGAVGISDTGLISVSGNSSFTVAGPASIILDTVGNTFTGTLTFAASAGTIAGITIFDTTAVTLPAFTITGNLVVNSGGLIDQSGAIAVGGTSSLTTGAFAITLGNPANDFGGALAFTNSLLNNVSLRDMNALVLAASSTGGNLSVIAGGDITDSGTLSITGSASFETWNNGGANITIDDDGIGPITGNFATVILRSMDAAGAALRGGTLILREASATVIDGLRTSGAATLQSAGTVTDALAAVLEASPLTIISVGGTTLDSAACALTSINVTNTGSGTIDVANTAANLAVTGLSQGAGAAVSISNTGAGTLTISGALTASVAASPLSLSAADMDIAAAITSGTNTVNLFPLPVSTDIFLGGAGAGLSLSQAELNNIATSGLLSIGSAAQTGTITINGNVALTGPTGPVSLLTNGAAITAANNFATAAVAGTNLTLNARAGAANTGSVSGGGLLTAGTAGAANLTVNAGAGINLTNVGNLANVVTLANSTSGNIAYYNNRAMTLIAANSAPGATLSVINATGTLTSSGAIMTTGGGAASITLSSAGGLVLSNAVTAGGTGFVTLLGAGATQAALITAPGGLRLGGTGNFILNQNNVLATLAANVTGNLNLTVTAALAIGTVDTISGVTIGLANTLTLTTGGALTQSQPIIAATGTFVLTNTTANTDLSTNDNQIATFGTLSAAGRIVRVRNTIASVQSGAITASALELTGGASFTWTQATNNIATLAASIGAFPLSYRDADAITIGFVGATNGITANAFTLVAGGTVSQTEPINVGALTGTLTVRTLNTPGAAIDLVTAGNEAAIVDLRSRDAGDSAPANGAISYIDATGFDIAALRTTTTATIESGGAAAHDLSQTGDIAVGGLLTITAGLGDAVFSRATNTLATVAVPSAAILSLNDADGYTLQACNTSGAITATTAAGNITVSGALSTVAGAGMGIDLNPAGTITLSLAGTVAATDGGLVRLRKAVALTQNTTIDTDAAGGSTAAGAVQFDAGISGPLFALVVDASADGGGANGAVTFAGVVATLASLTVTGDSFINGGTITTSVSGQTYTGPVVLGADTTFTAAAGQLIHFAGTLGGTATARAISIPAGNVRFDGTVGGVGNLVSTLSITAPSTTALNANITTSGNQIFGGAVTLGANSTVISGAGTMTFSSTVGQSGSRSLTIQNGTATGAVTLAGAVTLDSYVLGNGNYSVAMNGTGSAVANNVAFLNQGTLSLGQALGTITFNGGVSTTGNPTNPSTVTILGTIASSDDPITLGAITLGENATVTSAATTTAGDIILGAVTGGIFNLNLSTGNGIANADITASNFNGSASLALANVGGTAIFSGTVSAGTVAISNTNTATFSQAVTATNMTVPNTVTNVSLNGALGTITNMVAFLNSGTLSLGQAAGTLTFNGGFTTSGVGGTVTTYGTLLTSNDTITLGAITLGADTTLDTAAASAAGSVTLGAVTGGAFTLIISTSDTVGSVTQSSGTITATSLRIQTGGAIGTAGTPLSTAVSFFEGRAGGLINVSNTGNLTVGFGGGAYDLTGLSTGAGSNLSLTATGNLALTEAVSAGTTGTISLTANLANASLSSALGATISSGTGAITLTADQVALLANVASGAPLTIQPLSAGTTVSIGAAGGTFALDDAELVLLQDGFTAITLGRANSGAVTIDTANFRDPITILGGGVITVAAGTPSLATTQDNAPITITSSVLAGIIASGGISSNGSGFIDINSGAAFTEANGVAIASGSGNITIDTTDTNDQSINGTLVTGGIGTILLTASHSIIMDTDSAITSDTGTIILDADAVAAGSLVLDVVQSTGGAQITLRAGTGGTITEADNTALVSTSGLLFINDAAAGLSVGGAGNAALNTDVGTLRAQTSGNLYINEANAINLGNVGGGITSSGGLIDISAGGAITIAANVSASTGMTITSSANIDRTGGTFSSGGTMFLSAGTYIGVDTLSDGAADPTWIATSAANLRATAANGGMYINETNAIVLGDGIGGLTATNGDILVVAGGVITTANTISAAGAGSDIALTGTSITISNSLGATVTETFTGPTTVAAGATITGGSGLMLFNSAVTHNGGTITAGNLAAGTSAIRFVSTYTGTGGTLSGNNNVLYNPDIEFRGDVVFGTFTHNSDRIVFSGGAAQDFDTNLAAAPTNFLSDVLVNKTAGTLSLITNNVLQNGSSLRLQSGNLDLRANGRSWLMDSALGAIPAVAFTGRDGTLRLDAGTILQCNNFTSEAGHTIDNQGANTVDTQGDVSILGSFITPNNSTLVMHGPGFTLTAIPTTLGTQIGNLRISGLSSIELSPAIATSISLGADLYLYGNMIIDTSGSLDVTATPYNITVDGNWNNLIDDTAGPFTGFNARTGTVTFTNSSTTISGNNAWYVFAATLPGGTILFENSKRQTILTGGSFIAKGAAGNRLTLSRITGLQNVDLIWNPIFAPPNPSLMWQIDFLPGSSVITSEHLLIKYSDARSHPVVTPPDTELYNSEALPLPTDPFTAKTCYRWIDSIQAVNSYTEDSNGNGKIDRIRVTAEASLTYNFTGFDALVEDYEIDRTRGTNGFEPKLDAGPTPAYLGTEFFINLKEKPYVDTGTTPRWRFLFNTTLRDTSTDTKNLDTIETWMVPADNALPRVAYTLSYPGSNQVFIQFSEPVYAIGATVLSASDLGSSSLDRLTVSGTATSEALATYLAPFDAVTLASGTTDITLVATINDGAVPATNYSIDPYWTASGIVFPEPYYAYPVVTQPILDPNFIAATAHRATDVLISIPPSSAAADTYFVWPIWAKDSVSTAIAQSQYENLTPDEAASQTIGLIRDFTGDYWLRDQDFTLEARINPVLPATTALRLHLDTNVDASKSATSINGPAGLWLPIFAETAFSGIVPKPNEDTTAVLASSVGSNLWDFAVDADNPKIKSISTLDFFFTLGNENVLNPLYAGRLEMSPGAAIPANWYRLVKPFTFQIHDVKKQRGSVTILNNVIDPTKGERVRISYQLTKSGQTVIQVFTLDGDLIDVLYRGNRAAGDYTAIWDGRNRAGKAVARGMYFVRVVGPEIDEIRKVLVVK